MRLVAALAQQYLDGGETARAEQLLLTHLAEHPRLRRCVLCLLSDVEHGGESSKPHARAMLEFADGLLTRRALYRCGNCGFGGRRLLWQCPGCRKWGRFVYVTDLL